MALAAQPIRVFHLIKSLGRGGAEMLLTDGPESSDPAQFAYGFGYFLPHKNALVSNLERIGDVACFPATGPLGMLSQARSVAQHLRRWKADVVHCHLPLAGVVGRLAGAWAGVPVVYTEHNVIERYHPATRFAAKATWRLQRQVVAVSAEVKQSIARRFGDKVPVRVVRNGVSLQRFARQGPRSSEVRARLGLAEDAVLVGTVAVFRQQKRLDLWLRAASLLLRQHPQTRFLLVGDGPLKPQVEKQIQELGLSGKVHLPGLQPDVTPYLMAMDAYLMSSDFEGVPIALLEAMAMEVPPVVTRAGGIPEVVEDSVSGFLHPCGDVDALAASLSALIARGPEYRTAVGRRARARVAAEFSTARMMGELEEVYRDVFSL